MEPDEGQEAELSTLELLIMIEEIPNHCIWFLEFKEGTSLPAKLGL